MTTTETQPRCAACGKIIDSGQKTYRVAVGKHLADESFIESSEWGRLHEPCFGQAVDSPKLILAEVLKLTKTKTTVLRRPPKKSRMQKAG